MTDRDQSQDAIAWAKACLGWPGAQAQPFSGDASSRRYTRLIQGTETVILMESGGDVGHFARLAKALTTHGFSAPNIVALDPRNERMLIEDLGDATFARVLNRADIPAAQVYDLAVDVLVALRAMPVPDGLSHAGLQRLVAMVDPVFDYAASHNRPLDDKAKADLTNALCGALAMLSDTQQVLVLRDYHVENLMWLPERTGVRQAGLLDFQDALSGHPAYDLASLITDVRREVPPDTAQRVLMRYATASGLDLDILRRDVALLGAQRNLRILGIFTRLAAAGKRDYLRFLPQVYRHVEASLAHPDLGELRRIAQSAVPAAQS